MKTLEETATKIARLMKSATYITCLTGAGVSTDSGIPDFRSPKTGLWNKVEARILTEPGALEKHLDFFWKIGWKIGKKMLKAKPNEGHRILARWETEKDIIKSTITQNVDRLHQKAGSRHVIELHGNAFEATCVACGAYYPIKSLIRMYKARGKHAPSCEMCAGPIKPAAVLFGEPVPADEMRQAKEEVAKTDLMLCIGSSLVVYPANYLPVMVHEKGGKIVVINQMKTGLDRVSEIVAHESITDLLKSIDRLL